jgi:AcrR family transcriptional regulator
VSARRKPGTTRKAPPAGPPDEGDAGESSVPEMRRTQIVETAVRLFSESGYHDTTIDDIAREADISKGLVYKYFKDKNDVLFFVLCHVLEKYDDEGVLRRAATAGPLAGLRTLLRNRCEVDNSHIRECLLAYRSTKDLTRDQQRQVKVIESRDVRVIKQCLEACVHRGLMHPVDTDILAYQFIMYGQTWALKHWAYGDRFTIDEYVAEGEKILIWALLTERGRKDLETLRAGRGG